MELGSDVDPRQPDPVTTWKFYQPFRYTPLPDISIPYACVTHELGIPDDFSLASYC